MITDVNIQVTMRAYRAILVLLLAVSAVLSLCACEQKEPISLTIMSYNIRHGEGLDTIIDLSRAARIITSQSPDFCALQEVDNFCLRSDSIGQTAFLAKQTGLTGNFGKFMDYQGGAYGMATLSSLPVLSTKVLPLPDGKYEPRSSIVQEVRIAEDCSIVFANVHFDWIAGDEGSANRLKQAKALVDYLDGLGKASVIVGDFNCTPGSPTMQYFAEQGFLFVHKGADSLSYQGAHKAEIDHVIYRNTGKVHFTYNEVMLLDAPLVSDHRPLVVELEATIK